VTELPKPYKKHTSPETAGRQNMSKLKNAPPDEERNMSKLLGIIRHGNKAGYRSAWTPEVLADSIEEFFEYCDEVNMKPIPPALHLWLDVDKYTCRCWKNNPAKYGEKSVIIKKAYEIMEAFLQMQIDKYPTGSIFLLKTTHGHVETSKLDVTSNGETVQNADDVKDAVAKLGLDKPKLALVEGE